MLAGGGGGDDDTDIVPGIPGCGVRCGDGRCLAGGGAGGGHVTLVSGRGGLNVYGRGVYIFYGVHPHI